MRAPRQDVKKRAMICDAIPSISRNAAAVGVGSHYDQEERGKGDLFTYVLYFKEHRVEECRVMGVLCGMWSYNLQVAL